MERLGTGVILTGMKCVSAIHLEMDDVEVITSSEYSSG